MSKLKINTDSFLSAVKDVSNVKGYTHDFYNYPARFSPKFVREVITTLTSPGDLVVDPFVGGGTTLVESKILGRHAIGLDISSLAVFIAKVKTTCLKKIELQQIQKWIEALVPNLNCHASAAITLTEFDESYLRNTANKATWPIRKLIEGIIASIESSELNERQQNFIRCAVLKTGQWALDNRKKIPSANDFRKKLTINIAQMCDGASSFSKAVKAAPIKAKVTCSNIPSSEIQKITNWGVNEIAPKLILTSPPYPGVHVVYHRWQVQGRKETPAPFWIANSLDGHGLSYYTLGGRQQKGLVDYFSNIQSIFSAINKICSKDTIIVQMLAFSEINWQLPKYLEAMTLAGFQELSIMDERIWRSVPNRKWYANKKGKTDSSNEVVLFHKLIN